MTDDVRNRQRHLNAQLTPYHFPALALDGVAGPLTRQAEGAARLLDELGGGAQRRPGRWVVVDKTCQALVAGDANGKVRFVLPATTGTPEHETRLSDRATAFRYEPATENNGWRNSTTFPVASDDPWAATCTGPSTSIAESPSTGRGKCRRVRIRKGACV